LAGDGDDHVATLDARALGRRVFCRVVDDAHPTRLVVTACGCEHPEEEDEGDDHVHE